MLCVSGSGTPHNPLLHRQNSQNWAALQHDCQVLQVQLGTDHFHYNKHTITHGHAGQGVTIQRISKHQDDMQCPLRVHLWTCAGKRALTACVTSHTHHSMDVLEFGKHWKYVKGVYMWSKRKRKSLVPAFILNKYFLLFSHCCFGFPNSK